MGECAWVIAIPNGSFVVLYGAGCRADHGRPFDREPKPRLGCVSNHSAKLDQNT